MADFNIQVDDLVLYFTQADGTGSYRVLPRQVYENPDLQLDDVEPEWQGAVLNESGVADGEIFYVTNLTRLRDPVTASDFTKDLQNQPPADVDVSDFADEEEPALADLVVISNVDKPDDPKAYLIPRGLYETKLRPLPPEKIADIDFMVQEEGVLLANIRKFEHTGISCYLLNLTGLRSGQVQPVATKKKPSKPNPKVDPGKKAPAAKKAKRKKK